jgi:hypothetical protein
MSGRQLHHLGKELAMHIRHWTLALLLLVLSSLPARAHIHNGDFEKPGGADWTVNQPPNWTISFPASGGNPDGYGEIQSPFGNSQGLGSISQAFDCGTPTPGLQCVIMVDFRLAQIDASDGTGRVKVLIDNVVLFTSPSEPTDWRTLSLAVPCGDHEIALALEVDAGNNGWEASFDNAHAECDIATPVETSTWGGIKRQFD